MAESSIPPRSEGDPLAWKQKALDDLLAAEKLFETLSEYPSLSWEVGFHSQQAVEKFLKAILVAAGIVPSRTHDVAYLLDACLMHCPALESHSEELAWFTQLASEVRYPGGSDVSPADAQKALELARGVRDVVEVWFRNRSV